MENWNQAKEIFYSAINKSFKEREKFLLESCGDDSQLLENVRILIKSYKSEFLEQPILDFYEESLLDPLLQKDNQINHYSILRLLGRGGMGDVYLAKDKKLDRLVALKILHRGAGKQAEKRLLREARSIAGLDHPNICSIYEVGTTDKFPFIVMQYVEGETLDILIKKKSLALSESIRIIRQIAEALVEAHSHHIVHRDIKPSNIIVDGKKQVKVLDFSLAKKTVAETGAETESLLSDFGIIAGTVAYMSPEQARGQEIDARSDVWSLGVLFYELLSGALPFTGDSKSDVIASILTKSPPKLSGLNPDVPSEIDEIINKTLEKNRDERYRSVGNVLDDLESLSIHRQDFNRSSFAQIEKKDAPQTTAANFVSNVSASRSTFSELTKITDESTGNFKKVSTAVWKWILPIFLTLFVLSGGIYWKYFHNTQQFETFSPESREKWQFATLFSSKRKPDGAISDISFSPDGRLICFTLSGEGLSDIYIKQTDANEPIRVTDGKWNYRTPVWSPDGQKIAFISDRENKPGIWTVSYLSGTPVLQVPLEQTSSPSILKKWSNDGTRIYFENNGTLKTIELATGKIVEIKLPDAEIYGSFNISNDEKMIAYVVFEEKKEVIWVQNIETGEVKKITNVGASNWSPVFFSDNKRIVFSSNRNSNYQLYTSNLNGKEADVSQITFGDANANIPVVSPDGKKIVFVTEKDEANIFSLDLLTKKEMSLTANTKMQLLPEMSSGNKLLFQVTDDFANFLSGTIKIKELENNNEPVMISNYGGLGKWSPNGDKIAFLKYSGFFPNLWMIDVSSQKEKQLTTDGVLMERMTHSPFNLSSIPFNWSKDGGKIAYSSFQNGFMNIWTVDSGNSTSRMVTNNADSSMKYSSPIWSNSGDKISFLSRKEITKDKFQYEVMIISDNSIKSIFQSNFELRLLGWSNNDSKLFVAEKKSATSDISEINLLPSPVDKIVARLKDAQFESVSMSPDFTNIIFSARRNHIDNIFLRSISGRESQVTSNLEQTIYFSGIIWSENGKNVFFSKQTGGLQISMISDLR